MSAELSLAERALGLVGGEGQVTVTRTRALRAAFGDAPRLVERDVQTVRFVVLRDAAAGEATTTAVDDDALRAAAARAADAARTEHPGLPGPRPYRGHHGFDLGTASRDPGDALRRVDEAVATAGSLGVEARGVWEVAETRTAIASSAGIRASDATTVARAAVTAGRDGASAVAEAGAPAARDVDLAALVREAAGLLPAGPPADLAPGSYPVVLGEPAVAQVLDLLGTALLSGGEALAGRLGTRVAAACINLSDSPRFTGQLGRAFDAEGVPKAPLPLIQDGVAHRVVHDVRTAARAGTTSTGHADEHGGPRPAHLVLVGGGAADAAELAAPVGRGVYLHRFEGLAAAPGGAFTALGVCGARLIQDGELGAPLRGVRVSGSALGVVAGAQALGARPRLVPVAEDRAVVCPPMRVASLDVR